MTAASDISFDESFSSATAALSNTTASRAQRALELRRMASKAGALPLYWQLDSPALQSVVETARQLARAAGTPVLIEGERGTGVQELARLVHDADPVAGNNRLRTIAADLVSPADMPGRLDGTLFIEDVENLRPAGQHWLTHLLERRNKSTEPVRVVASSRHSVDQLLRCKGVNEELIHALDVGRLVLPPLRARPEDILRLARSFLHHYSQWQRRPELHFSAAAESKLLGHNYPANVRELRNIVERAAALAARDEIGEDAIVLFDRTETTKAPAETFLAARRAVPAHAPYLPTMVELERDYLVMLIRELKGRRSAISRAMGVSYPTVLKKIARHGLDVRAIVASTKLSPSSRSD